jgi:hypothetical protein
MVKRAKEAYARKQGKLTPEEQVIAASGGRLTKGAAKQVLKRNRQLREYADKQTNN